MERSNHMRRMINEDSTTAVLLACLFSPSSLREASTNRRLILVNGNAVTSCKHFDRQDRAANLFHDRSVSASAVLFCQLTGGTKWGDTSSGRWVLGSKTVAERLRRRTQRRYIARRRTNWTEKRLNQRHASVPQTPMPQQKFSLRTRQLLVRFIGNG